MRFAMGIPQATKMRGGELKHLLKRAVRGVIPDAIIDRRKQGFGVPVAEWFLRELGPVVRESLQRFAIEQPYFDAGYVDRLLQSNNATLSWFLLNFALWHRQWIEGKAAHAGGTSWQGKRDVKRNPFRSDYQRLRRLSARRVAAAVGRKGRVLLGGLAAEVRARVRGTAIGDREFRAACRPAAGDPAVLLADGGWLFHRGFFLDPGARRRVMESFPVAYPEAISATMESAERICAHRFDLLGSGPTDLGPQIDWHRDFKSDFRWDPRVFSTRLRYGDVIGADVKVPWELSRCQHLPTLGKAYWLTGDDRYATEFVAQLTHWMAENPPQFGVNWACTMDVAIRAFNWLWGYAFFHDAPQVTPAFRRALAGSLLAHGRHIRRTSSGVRTGSPATTTWRIWSGLVGLGFACPIFHEAQAWREFSLAEIFREIERQVHPDGGDYESSIPYHRLVTEMFLAVAILCRRNGVALPEPFPGGCSACWILPWRIPSRTGWHRRSAMPTTAGSTSSPTIRGGTPGTTDTSWRPAARSSGGRIGSAPPARRPKKRSGCWGPRPASNLGRPPPSSVAEPSRSPASTSCERGTSICSSHAGRSGRAGSGTTNTTNL